MNTGVRFRGRVEIVAPMPLPARGGAVALLAEPEETAAGGYGLGRRAHWALVTPAVPYAHSAGQAALRQTGDFHREAARLFADTLEAAALLAQDAPPLTQVTLHALTDVYLQGMLALLSQGPAPTAGDGEASGTPPLLVDDLTDRLVSFSASYLDRIRVLCSEGE